MSDPNRLTADIGQRFNTRLADQIGRLTLELLQAQSTAEAMGAELTRLQELVTSQEQEIGDLKTQIEAAATAGQQTEPANAASPQP